ncbi:NUDIX hydrolase [Actinomyces howellii]|uniref:RNA pyrophosphohydrolase n=1 Tax=Actinomyces howellii TaxID=52771 RepID=A0A448HIA3_9ACTO|nr:NUDIX domain-containing protein [Actinomyces howellii]VEG29125.1 RNA pyrophosphohydrolase [Actinomyces howellii]
MPTPEFIVSLRTRIGHDQLWLPGVSLVVLDEADRVLLGRRADNGRWGVVSGIPEPGEQPAAAALRECVEETGVRPEILGVCRVLAEEPFAFPNGDRCVFMDTTFVARAHPEAAAQARVGDEESTAVGWFDLTALPEPLLATTPPRIEVALAWLADPVRAARFA